MCAAASKNCVFSWYAKAWSGLRPGGADSAPVVAVVLPRLDGPISLAGAAWARSQEQPGISLPERTNSRNSRRFLARVRIAWGSQTASLRSGHTCGVVSVPAMSFLRLHSHHNCFGTIVALPLGAGSAPVCWPVPGADSAPVAGNLQCRPTICAELSTRN